MATRVAQTDLRRILERRLHPTSAATDAIRALAGGCYIGRSLTSHSKVHEALAHLAHEVAPYWVDSGEQDDRGAGEIEFDRIIGDAITEAIDAAQVAAEGTLLEVLAKRLPRVPDVRFEPEPHARLLGDLGRSAVTA